MNKLIEALVSRQTPGQDGDPTTLDSAAFDNALRQVRDRFVDERVKGWTHPETKQYQAPVSKEDAERRWLKHEQKFKQALLRGVGDPEVQKRLRLSKPMPKASDYFDTDNFRRSNRHDPADAASVLPVEGSTTDFPDLDAAGMEQGWDREKETPYERGMRDEPSLRRGESKASKVVNKLIG